MKSWFRTFPVGRALTIALGLAIVGWAATKLDWRLIGQQLAGASLPAELAMALAWLAVLFIRPVRLLMLVRKMAPDINGGYWPIWSSNTIAMATNSILPLRAGDLTMAFVLRRSIGISAARAYSVVLVDRFFDFVTVIVIFVSMLSLAPTVASWAHELRVTLLAALVALAAGLWVIIALRAYWIALVDRLLSGLPPPRSERWRARVRDLFAGLEQIDSLGAVVPIALLSVGLWAMTAVSYWFGAIAVWPEVSAAAAAFAVAAVALSFIVPVAPGGVGVFHGAVVLSLALFKVPLAPALAFALVAHAFQLGSVLLLGALAIIRQGISVRSLLAPEAASAERGRAAEIWHKSR